MRLQHNKADRKTTATAPDKIQVIGILIHLLFRSDACIFIGCDAMTYILSFLTPYHCGICDEPIVYCEHTKCATVIWVNCNICQKGVCGNCRSITWKEEHHIECVCKECRSYT